MNGTAADAHRLAIDETSGVATITLDRPQAYNALTAALLEELLRTFVALERDERVRVIVLTGAGKGFCSGQALDDERTVPPHGVVDIRAAVAARYNPLLLKMLTIEKPIVAAINGIAAGAGMGLALACDLRIASEAASFTTAFVKIGLVPDSGLSFLLPRLVGYGRALELTLLSERFDAARALEIGLITRVVPAETLSPEAHAMAAMLARGPRALGLVKREFAHNGLGEVREALAYEAEMQAVAGATEDFREGLAAFRAKRAPSFSGR